MNAITIERKTTRNADWRERLKKVEDQIETFGLECDLTGTFVSRNLEILEDLGFFALGVPSDLGGGGASYPEVAAMLRAVGRLDGSTALTLSMHTHQVMVAEWKRRVQSAPTEGVLKKVAGEHLRIVSSGGSDWLPGSGRAEKVEGGYRIYARKVFSSGAPAGDVMNTSAIYQDEEAGPVVLHFPLPMKAPGVTVLSNWDTLGMRGTASQDVEIDGVFIPDSAIAATRPRGKWHPLFHLISLIAFPLIYSVYAGIADRAREIALEKAAKRVRDDAALIGVGELENTHAAMDLAIAAMVELGSTATPSPETTHRIMTLRGLVGRSAMDVGSKALDVAGGAGFFSNAGLERRFRDLQAARSHPLQDRQQQLYAGRFVLGADIDG
ncbi:MAG TPA: acyl-CoA dehydrogenase family protein [Caulobacteraceae bacterium]|nr:acyl-CoA dehydrogenase family protein [Caulobacteraceae bacterium]